LGVLEIMSSSVSVTSSNPANLILGIAEDLNASISIQSFVNDANLSIGESVVLSGTVSISSDCYGLTLVTGVLELLSSNNMIISYVNDADLSLGESTILSGTVNISSNVNNANLILGIVELMSSTIISLASTASTLYIGSIEQCFSTISINSNTTAELEIGGGIVDLSVTHCNIVVNASASEIILGLQELVAATSIITTSTGNIVIDTGSGEILNTTSSCHSYINAHNNTVSVKIALYCTKA
jgi:hypothetical protein